MYSVSSGLSRRDFDDWSGNTSWVSSFSVLFVFDVLYFSCTLCLLLFSRYICRPGAGKSTVSQAAVRLLGDGDGSTVCTGKLSDVDEFLYIYLDLDVCVPQWMRVSLS